MVSADLFQLSTLLFAMKDLELSSSFVALYIQGRIAFDSLISILPDSCILCAGMNDDLKGSGVKVSDESSSIALGSCNCLLPLRNGVICACV